jgi:hypothetical protein
MLPQLDDALTVGSVFHWESAGLQITSTVQEVDPPRRIVWSGPAQGITAIHVWEFTPTDHGVLVHTEESWDGEVVRAQTATLQQALDGSLRAWLTNLKRAAEQAGRLRFGPHARRRSTATGTWPGRRRASGLQFLE